MGRQTSNSSSDAGLDYTYGGDFAWVDAHYKMRVLPGASPLQWMNALVKRMLVLDDIALAADGTFRQPADGTLIFPRRGIDLRWRFDTTKESIVVDFWDKGKLMKWRWDVLQAKPEMVFPSTVPDFSGVGHVGKFTFAYELVSAAGVSNSSGNLAPMEKLFLSLEPASEEGGANFDWWRKSLEEEHARSGYDGLGVVFASPPLVSRIGEGSFGVVWLAQNRDSGYRYAVKNMITKQGNADSSISVAQNEFEVIYKIMAQPHPGIVTFFALESFPIPRGELYLLVMEYCPGGDLQEALDKHVQLLGRKYEPPAESLQWIGQIFLAVEHIHTKLNLLIRDLKPGNVILDKRRSAKLTDFGCGRLVAEAAGGNWTFCFPPGTPGYAAPELLAKESYTYPVDIFSFGVVAWVILSGGCRLRQSVGPPSAGGGPAGGDFSIYASDWRILDECLKSPNRARCPVSAQPLALISTMVQVDASSRPDCQAVRNSVLFQEAILPLIEKSPSNSWVLDSSSESPLNQSVSDGAPDSFNSLRMSSC